MANTYTELFYHFVWAAKDRQPLITLEMEPHLLRYVRSKCKEMEVLVHAVNSMPDHVHLACSLPVDLCISECIGKIKGSSAHFINHLPDHDFYLNWQTGYGALTFAKRDLPGIVGYISNQKQHHSAGKLYSKMELLDN